MSTPIYLSNISVVPIPSSTVSSSPSLCSHDLGQPFLKIETRLPIGQIVDQDDSMDIVHEHVTGVPLAVAAANVPELHEIFLLILRPLQILVEFDLHRASNRPSWR